MRTDMNKLIIYIYFFCNFENAPNKVVVLVLIIL